MRQLPKILTINHGDWRRRSIKVVEQARVHADAARGSVPAAIWLKSRAVAEGAAPTGGAEMVRYQFGVPAVIRITSAITCEMKLRWFVVRMQHAAFGTKRASAAGQCGGNVAVDLKSDLAAMATA